MGRYHVSSTHMTKPSIIKLIILIKLDEGLRT